ncbi:hypothetical protein V6N12_028362 [Hibiscus sabdariffa]|uniref:RNase H type-1 domain-containing protein n=1 Tax=Hibiscus sabdariffa TaxID=183260 RepID=A0ABR2F5P1_9ROSI
MEEVEPVDPVSLSVEEKTARDKALDKGVVVGVTSSSSADGNEVSGTSPSHPVLEHQLPISALESLIAIQASKPQYVADIPGWRDNELSIECNKAFRCIESHQIRSGIREKLWKGPASDWVEVNVDAPVDTVGNRAAVGGLIRDDSGGWLRGFYRFVGRCSILLAELWARDWLVMVSHVSREENAAADKLAALGKGYGKDGRVFVVPPGVVASIVGHDQRRWMEERSRGADVAAVESDAS